MTGSYASQGEHEAALAAAEAQDMVAIRVIKAPYPNWQKLYTHLMAEGDAEGTCWLNDPKLNDALRVVGPAKSGLSCWFSLFLPRIVYEEIKFVDGVYDLSKIAGGDQQELRDCIAVRDTIFMRRGVDHGAVVEITQDLSKNPHGHKSIEDSSPVEMWRLTQRLALYVERYFDVQQGTRIAIRTRYRPHKLLVIHSVMVASKAHSMGLEWKMMHKLRQLAGQPANMDLNGRCFRITDFAQAEAAHAPLNDKRLESQQASDQELQGRRCTIDNLPSTCNQARLEDMLAARGLSLGAKPVIIDSKFRTGTRVAFVVFADEDMALTAILEAPFMLMSGTTPTIKPSQPKNNRPLSRVESDERSRMQALGPTDGMSRRQLADVVRMVDNTPPGATLDFLRQQLKINEEGTFANGIANAIKAEMRALQTDIQDMRDDIKEAIWDLDATVQGSVDSHIEFRDSMIDTVQTISDEHQGALDSVNTSLSAIATNMTAQEANHRLQLQDINTQLEALNEALRHMAFAAAPGYTPLDQTTGNNVPWGGHGYDSDDSHEEAQDAQEPVRTAPRPSSPTDSDITAIPTNLIIQDPVLAQMDLGGGLTPTLCVQLLQEWNASSSPSQHLEDGPTSTQLLANAILARGLLAAREVEHLNAPLPKANPAIGNNQPLDLGPPMVRLVETTSRVPNPADHPSAKHVPNIKDMFERQAVRQTQQQGLAAQGQKRQAASPTRSATPDQTRDLALVTNTTAAVAPEQACESPPRTRQRPEMSEEQATEYIFRLTNLHPDVQAYQSLLDGYPASLIPRGVRARDILDSITPRSSPLVDDANWVPRPNTATIGMVRGPAAATLQGLQYGRK
jgi:hypothetical protein